MFNVVFRLSRANSRPQVGDDDRKLCRILTEPVLYSPTQSIRSSQQGWGSSLELDMNHNL